MPSSPFQRLWKFISYVSQQVGHFWLPFICSAVWISLAESNKLPKQMNGNQKWPSNCETYEMNFHRRWKGDDGIYFGYRFWFHCLYEQNGLFFGSFFHANGVFGILSFFMKFLNHACLPWKTRVLHAQTIHICHIYGTSSQIFPLHNQPSHIFELLQASLQQNDRAASSFPIALWPSVNIKVNQNLVVVSIIPI